MFVRKQPKSQEFGKWSVASSLGRYTKVSEFAIVPCPAIRDGPLFFYQGGGTIFGTCRQFFLESNAFQTIFFITFCNENNFFTTILKNVTGFFIDLI